MGDNDKEQYDNAYERMYSELGEYCPVSENLRELIIENSILVKFSKGEMLLEESRECDFLYFIVSGFCSCYYNKDGKEYILRFAGAGEFCTSWHSFLGRQHSLFNIKATEETLTVCFRWECFDKLKEENLEFAIVVCKMLEHFAMKSEEKYFRMRSCQAEGRVRHSLDTREMHYLMRHVPRYNIASYLNMTQETFSKIFTQLNKELR